jgi:ATP-dependent helicase Lhr and Lhr-like helicase
LFGGRRWKVEMVDLPQKVVEVSAARGGRAPAFGGTAGVVHGEVRKRMKMVLSDEQPIRYLDHEAQDLLRAAREVFRSMSLSKTQRVTSPEGIQLFLWQGDEVQNTIALLLKSKGIEAKNEGICLALSDCGPSELDKAFASLLKDEVPIAETLLRGAENLVVEKWDMLLPSPLRERNYASLFLDIAGAYSFFRSGTAPLG